MMPLFSFDLKLTSTNFSDFVASISFDGSFFSTPRTTPSFVLTPIAVEPNFNQVLLNANSYLDCLNSILNLIYTTFRRESVNTTIVVFFTI